MNLNLKEASAVNFRFEVRAAINCYSPAPVNGQTDVLFGACERKLYDKGTESL